MAFIAGRRIARDDDGHVFHTGPDGGVPGHLLVITPKDLDIAQFDVAPKALVLSPA
jgi:hypothetical protein